jgi:two-component system cell cycle response regulator
MRTKILVAEDDAVSQRLLSGLLAKWGYDVLAVSDGLEAMRVLEREDSPALVILDWLMPGSDGVDVIKQLRAQQQPRYRYVLLVTSKGEKRDILTGLDAGADDYLTKPFDASELNARLRVGQRILDLQRQLVSALEVSEFRATHDGLTGLFNRSAISELLHREVLRCSREHQSISALMADVDHFKRINDTHGHLVGDEVLKNVSSLMKGSLRSYDFVGRYGGEEFLVVLPTCEQAEALAVAERIRASVADSTLELAGLPIKATVSLGVGSCPCGSYDANELVRVADHALYKAKERGRNRVECGEEMTTLANDAAAGGLGRKAAQ